MTQHSDKQTLGVAPTSEPEVLLLDTVLPSGTPVEESESEDQKPGNASGFLPPESAEGVCLSEQSDAPQQATAVPEPQTEIPAGEGVPLDSEQGAEEVSPETLQGQSSPWPKHTGALEPEAEPQEESAPAFVDPEAGIEEIPAGSGGNGKLPPLDGGETDEDEPEQRPMTLLDHLGELRRRLVRSTLAVVVAFLVCYGFAKELFYYLSLPLLAVMPPDAKFIYTGVAEGFFVDLKVSFVAAVFAACPFIFYQIWAFIAPGLYDEEKKYIVPLAFCSALFFFGGAIFCYFVVFPFAFTFFMSYSTENIVAMLSINEYLSFALKMLIAFGLIFEMPLFAFFLARMGLITAAWMRSVRKYAVLCVFIVAAILTPPDVFSQIMMAMPMLVLYEVSIWVVVVFGKRKPKENTEEGEAA